MAVNNDAAFKNTEKEYKRVRLTIVIIWIVSIIGMTIFTFVIGYNSRGEDSSPTGMYQYEESVINSSENFPY